MGKKIQIAIDGPAAAGKSTIAKHVASKLGYTYIDTGAMYRALTYKALCQNINSNDADGLERLLRETEMDLLPLEGGQAVIMDGSDVSDEIRSPEVTASVSEVSSHQGVRSLMVAKQRELAKGLGVVMDGRDIGTHVLPNADLKVFMTASVDERALRRQLDNQNRGIVTTLEALKKEISDRDRADSEREVSPLRQAEDAVLLDTTGMSIEDVVDTIIRLVEKKVQS